MRAHRGIGLALAVFLAVGGCSQEQPPQTRPLEGNRGAIKPGGIRALKPGEPKLPSTAKKP
jgi:hypothetical protein